MPARALRMALQALGNLPCWWRGAAGRSRFPPGPAAVMAGFAFFAVCHPRGIFHGYRLVKRSQTSSADQHKPNPTGRVNC